MNSPHAFLAAAACAQAPSVLTPWEASLELGFTRTGSGTRLTHRAHLGPLRVQRALHPEGPRVCHAIVLHPPGGVAGGDHLHIKTQVHAGAHALITTPGAAKWYKSAGRWAAQHTHLQLEAGSHLEWLPQETIIFDAAQARMHTRIDLTEGARYCGWEILCLGRSAAGERFRQGQLRLSTGIWRGGRPLWIEQGGVTGGSAWLNSPVGLGGDLVWGTLVFAGTPPHQEQLDRVRALPLPAGVRLAATALPEVLLIRAMGPLAESVRLALQQCWCELRPTLLGVPPRLPRIWAT